jgi:hypothetical protein
MNDNAISLEEFWGVVTCLTDDMKMCLAGLDATPEENEELKSFWRRMYARTVFAFFDGVTYRMMFHAYAARDRRDVTFSLDELMKLEKSYDFDEDAEETVVTFSQTQMLEDIKFAFNAFARVHYSDYIFPTHDPNWITIKEIAHIRQAVQSPREAKELEVYDENIDVLVEGVQWFVECLVELLESSRKHAIEKFAEWEANDDEIVM